VEYLSFLRGCGPKATGALGTEPDQQESSTVRANLMRATRYGMRAGPSGVFILIDDAGQQMMGVFAEFERAMIWDRVKAGLDRDRAEVRRWAGRPSVARPMPRSARR
jgi:hypothetical protein